MTLTCNQIDEEYCQIVRRMRQAIRGGEDLPKVVQARRFSLPCPSALAAYHTLKKGNPNLYMFFIHNNEFTLFGASPESSLKYDLDSGQIKICPITGTVGALLADASPFPRPDYPFADIGGTGGAEGDYYAALAPGMIH